MANKRISFTKPTVTAQIIQPNGNYFWTAFAKDSNGDCNLTKASAFNIEQLFFSLNRQVDSIVEMDVDSFSIFLAYDDAILIGEKLSLNNPLSSTTQMTIPIGIIEAPIDVKVGSSLYFLTPGIASGTVANIIRYDLFGNFQQIIELSKSGADVNNAASFSIDASGDLWVVTNSSPSQYVRVFDTGSFIWDFEIFDTI